MNPPSQSLNPFQPHAVFWETSFFQRGPCTYPLCDLREKEPPLRSTWSVTATAFYVLFFYLSLHFLKIRLQLFFPFVGAPRVPGFDPLQSLLVAHGNSRVIAAPDRTFPLVVKRALSPAGIRGVQGV